MAFNNVISDFGKVIVGHLEHPTEKGPQNESNRADALVTTSEATLESFADVDEKKILRKVKTPPLRDYRVYLTYEP